MNSSLEAISSRNSDYQTDVIVLQLTGNALFRANIRLDGNDSSLAILLLPGGRLNRFQPTSSDVDPTSILTECSSSSKT